MARRLQSSHAAAPEIGSLTLSNIFLPIKVALDGLEAAAKVLPFRRAVAAERWSLADVDEGSRCRSWSDRVVADFDEAHRAMLVRLLDLYLKLAEEECKQGSVGAVSAPLALSLSHLSHLRFYPGGRTGVARKMAHCAYRCRFDRRRQ